VTGCELGTNVVKAVALLKGEGRVKYEELRVKG
jgi:hypothetical protein